MYAADPPPLFATLVHVTFTTARRVDFPGAAGAWTRLIHPGPIDDTLFGRLEQACAEWGFELVTAHDSRMVARADVDAGQARALDLSGFAFGVLHTYPVGESTRPDDA